ncbi:hypothetical protein CEXT_193071 [Caerostris extrusa]|uniref:Uncharacterized protein n=1 Tax=Caerostris extrusa TaxID=172846 RepID=A0AAV4RTU5_CAEEX|nr:hypothetical protein CEXT_193071 [Caerostris extrusa]
MEKMITSHLNWCLGSNNLLTPQTGFKRYQSPSQQVIFLIQSIKNVVDQRLQGAPEEELISKVYLPTVVYSKRDGGHFGENANCLNTSYNCVLYDSGIPTCMTAARGG